MPTSFPLNDDKLSSPAGALADSNRRLMLIVLGAVFAAAVRGAQQHFRKGTLLVDSYWASFYLLSYQDGFRRRALMGSLVRIFEPAAVDVRVINVIAILVLVAILVLFVRTFVRVATLRSAWTDLFAFTLFASCLLSVYFEVLGDTLQIAMLLFIAVAVAPLRWVSNGAVRVCLGLGGLAMGFFIHEASIFFLAPCIPFLVRGWPRIRDFIIPGLAVCCLLALSIHWSALNAHLTYQIAMYPHKASLNEMVGTPTFKELLHTEFLLNFTRNKTRIAYAFKYLKVFFFVVASWIVLSQCLARPAMKRIVYALLAILLFSVPLFAIAHDWGRFLGYDLFLALLVTSTRWTTQSSVEPSYGVDRWVSGIVDWVNRLVLNEPLRLAVILLLLISPYDGSREWIIRSKELIACMGIFAVALIAGSSASVAGRNHLKDAA